jgi:dipeptidyl aminopeptidase/acylaminoacyl peptidase
MRKLAVVAGVVVALLQPVTGQRAQPSREPVYSIAFASFAPLNTDIFIADADGSNAKPLIAHPDLDYNPPFSPDGRWVVFTSTRNGSADLFRVRSSDEALERLTDDAAFDDQGVISPDGRYLAFVSSRSGQADIWVLELGSGAARNLTNHPAGDFRPSWSPDGQWIAFSSDRDSRKPMFTFAVLHSTKIVVVRADGSALRRVTSRNAAAGSPTWSQDGKRLVISRPRLPKCRRFGAPWAGAAQRRSSASISRPVRDRCSRTVQGRSGHRGGLARIASGMSLATRTPMVEWPSSPPRRVLAARCGVRAGRQIDDGWHFIAMSTAAGRQCVDGRVAIRRFNCSEPACFRRTPPRAIGSSSTTKGLEFSTTASWS